MNPAPLICIDPPIQASTDARRIMHVLLKRRIAKFHKGIYTVDWKLALIDTIPEIGKVRRAQIVEWAEMAGKKIKLCPACGQELK